MASFIFDANKMTPEQLARRRDLANLMMAKATSRAPRDVGEGLNAIGQAIAGRVIDNRTGAEEDRRRSAASEAFSSALSGWGMGGGGATPSGASAATPAAPASITGDKQSFVDMILPAALREGQGIGVDPRIIVAQAALESGWGKSAPGNNYFGIKSHGQPGGMTLPTTEYVGGQKVNVSDSFRRFDSPDAAVSGYARFLTENPRYRPMLGAAGNFDKQIEELGKSGYATDPNYAAKVAQIARGITLPETASDATPAMTGSAPMAAPAPAAPQGGGLDPALIKLMGDPYLSDGQRAVLSAIVEQRMKSMDPANRLDMDYRRAQIAKLEREATGVGELGLNPQTGVNAKGEPVLIQIGKDGRAVETKLPEGITLSKEPIKLDAGTHFVLLDPITRQPVGQIPKELAAAEREKSVGKAEGEAAASLPGAAVGAARTVKMIDDLLTDPELNRYSGVESYMPDWMAGAVSGGKILDLRRRVEQLRGTAFLEAYNGLRGGGQITEVEGKKAEAALARLDGAQTDEAFRNALLDFRDAVEQGYQKLRANAGQGGQGSPAAAVTTPPPVVSDDAALFKKYGIE